MCYCYFVHCTSFATLLQSNEMPRQGFWKQISSEKVFEEGFKFKPGITELNMGFAEQFTLNVPKS